MRFYINDDVLFVFGGDAGCRMMIRYGPYIIAVCIVAMGEVVGLNYGISNVDTGSICVEKVIEIWEQS